MMINRTWLCFFGAVLLMSAAPLVYGTQSSASTHTTAKKKKRTASSNSRRKAKPRAQMEPTPDRIREIQSALQREGAYQGDPSGKWDDSTVQAMKDFQDKNGLTPTGKIDALSLQKLGLGAETAGQGAPAPAPSSASPPSPSSP